MSFLLEYTLPSDLIRRPQKGPIDAETVLISEKDGQ